MYTYMCIYIYIYTYTLCVYNIYIYIYIYNPNIHIYTYICICIYMSYHVWLIILTVPPSGTLERDPARAQTPGSRDLGTSLYNN